MPSIYHHVFRGKSDHNSPTYINCFISFCDVFGFCFFNNRAGTCQRLKNMQARNITPLHQSLPFPSLGHNKKLNPNKGDHRIAFWISSTQKAGSAPMMLRSTMRFKRFGREGKQETWTFNAKSKWLWCGFHGMSSTGEPALIQPCHLSMFSLQKNAKKSLKWLPFAKSFMMVYFRSSASFNFNETSANKNSLWENAVRFMHDYRLYSLYTLCWDDSHPRKWTSFMQSPRSNVLWLVVCCKSKNQKRPEPQRELGLRSSKAFRFNKMEAIA